MRFSTNDFLYATSYALDCVESQVLGTTRYHSKRTGYLASLMGRALGMGEKERLETAACAMLHDNALTEYLQLIHSGAIAHANDIRDDFGPHCEMGERNLTKMPFYQDCTGAVLYHHEKADGTGPFGKLPEEVPQAARLIHLADNVDTVFALGTPGPDKYDEIRKYISAHTGTFFDEEAAGVFLDSISYEDIQALKDEYVTDNLRASLPVVTHEYSTAEIMDVSTMFARIIDYKSRFTRTHTAGVAQKSYDMAKYYGYDDEACAQIYLAGALHDIGKLTIDPDVLEKPDKLTDNEFEHIKTHAYETYRILSPVEGLEDITEWASMHHEKLDGTGYPFGKSADELNKNDRILACIDIYQALTEERPYKKEISHADAMKILYDLAGTGKLDRGIVRDLDTVFA